MHEHIRFLENRAQQAVDNLRAIFETKEFQEALARELGTRMTAIFVFASNHAGLYGKGAGLTARRSYGAQLGVGEGLTGNAYAIPTKSKTLESLTLEEVAESIEKFKKFARRFPTLSFNVTRVGCGLGEFSEDDIRPLFANAPPNCELPKGWR